MLAPTQEEIQARRKATAALGVSIGVLVFLLLWITVFRGTIPPEDEVIYVLQGYVGQSTQSEAASKAAPPVEASPSPSTHPTTPTPKPQKAAASESTEEETSSQEKASESAEETPSQEEEESTEEALYEKGETDGQEQGNATFLWGEGEEGLQGRKPLYIQLPEYTSDREAKIRFAMLVDASGKVKHVSAITPGAPQALRNAGIEAIYQWKFNPLPGTADQRIVVTIVFRLR